MANDYYNPVSLPKEFTRARAGRISGEYQNVQHGFGLLPKLNTLRGNAQVLASEAAGSTANAILLESQHALTEYEVGTTVRWVAGATNSAAATVNVDRIAAKDVKLPNGSAVAAGDIRAGWVHQAVYDGFSMVLQNPATETSAVLALATRVPVLSLIADVAMTSVTLPAAQLGTSPYTYAIEGTLPTGLSFNATTRVLSGTPTVIAETDLTYKVTDSATTPNVLQAPLRIRVVHTVLNLTDPADRRMTSGSSQSFALPAATGGTEPYEYSINGLPPGLVFDPGSRRISGVPSVAGVYQSVQYSVTDAEGDTVTQLFSLEVLSSAALALQGIADRSFTVSKAITAFTLPAATGGLPAYTYTVTGLPTGLSFDATSREVTGTPSGTGTSAVTYSVTDANAISESVTFNIVVVAVGFRYVFVVDTGQTVTSDRITAGTPVATTAEMAVIPTFTGNKKLGLAQPASIADVTFIGLSGLGNAFSGFTKGAATVTVGSTAYEYWLSNSVQGDSIAGSTLNFR